MSSKSTDKKFVKIDEYKDEEFFDLKRVIIPFSLVFLKDEKFIYEGSEKIPFGRRDPFYQEIFLNEFEDLL